MFGAVWAQAEGRKVLGAMGRARHRRRAARRDGPRGLRRRRPARGRRSARGAGRRAGHAAGRGAGPRAARRVAAQRGHRRSAPMGLASCPPCRSGPASASRSSLRPRGGVWLRRLVQDPKRPARHGDGRLGDPDRDEPGRARHAQEDPPRADRELRRARLRGGAAGRSPAPVRGRAGGAHHGGPRGQAALAAVPRHRSSVTSGGEQGSCLSPSRPTTRARASSTSTTRTRAATSGSSSTGARAHRPTSPTPGRPASC